MKPRIPITDPRFAYTDAVHTNVAETFRRVREQMKRDAEARDAAEAAAAVKVRAIAGKVGPQ